MAEVLGSLSNIAADVSRARLLAEALVHHARLASPILFMLGPFMFTADTAAPQQLSRKDSYQWASVPRVGREPGQQFTGQGDTTININGVIYPYHKGGLGQMEYFRSLAGFGVPYTLVDGRGVYYGTWCITGVDEKNTVFEQNGTPRKIEFAVSLKWYGEYDDGLKLPF